jgi:hypothetical protein
MWSRSLVGAVGAELGPGGSAPSTRFDFESGRRTASLCLLQVSQDGEDSPVIRRGLW